MEERSHLAIGEVLTLLREEFPDVTISKIRFLESQGLVDPERTPSGYRKFYDADVARLRWILLQQKENFLPLKVIKDRLGELDASGRAVLTTEASQAPLGLDPSSPAASENAEPGAEPSTAGSLNGGAPEGSPAPVSAAAEEQAAVGGVAGARLGAGATAATEPGGDDARAGGPSDDEASAGRAEAETPPRRSSSEYADRGPMPAGAAGTGPNFARRSVLGAPPGSSPAPTRPGRLEPRLAERGPLVGRGSERRPSDRARVGERARPESPAPPGALGVPPSRGTSAGGTLSGTGISAAAPASSRPGPIGSGGSPRERAE
ncbi:MAG: MerR family DNA-binding transcriptional regulator, partial [Acidimicrobiaceae bacterium]|nr:MerR family DNA-binding transcriptional regulator [Acidimicrobiaceae bacterium]